MNGKSYDLWLSIDRAFREVIAAIPSPIAPDAHAHQCLCDATECCADESCNVPAEAREAAL
jgi:hypothetical protein